MSSHLQDVSAESNLKMTKASADILFFCFFDTGSHYVALSLLVLQASVTTGYATF
jgi:hypothetical protein